MSGYSFHPAAEAEALEAAEYYERRVAGLAASFRLELSAAIDLLLRHPEAAPRSRTGLRKMGLNRFPYSLLYAVENDELRIYAVVHHKRRPGYWLGRLRG